MTLVCGASACRAPGEATTGAIDNVSPTLGDELKAIEDSLRALKVEAK